MKVVLRIFNIVICAMAALCVTMFAIQPAIQLDVSYSVSKDQIVKVLGENDGYDVDGDGVKEVNLRDAVPEEGVKLDLNAKLTLTSLINVAKAEEGKAYEALKDEFLKPVVESVLTSESIKTLVDTFASYVAKTAAKIILDKQMLENFVPEGYADNFLEQSGITSEYMDSKIDNLYDAFTAEDATIESVTQALAENLNDVLDTLKENNPDDQNIQDLQNINAADMEQPLTDMLKEYELMDDEGNIVDMEEALALVLDKFLNGEITEEGGSGEGEGEGGDAKLPAVTHYADTPEGETRDIESVLSDVLWSYVGQSIQPFDPQISIVSKAMLGVVVFFMALWAGIFIAAFIKIFSKNKPYIYTGPLYWIITIVVGVIQIILGGIPLFLNFILKTFQNVIPSDVYNIVSSLNMQMKTSFIISFVCGVILFVISIVYSTLGHKVKKNWKKEKKARKLAAEAAK